MPSPSCLNREFPLRVALFLLVTALAGGLMVLTPKAAYATVNGGCIASADASRTGHINLATATVWHLRNDDVVTGVASAPPNVRLTGFTLWAHFFGIAFPVLSDTATGTHGRKGPYAVSDYNKLVRVLGLGAQAGHGTCTGKIVITFDDTNPVGTVAGGGGTALGILGLLGLLGTAFGRGGVGGRIAGAVSGLLGGLGFGLLLQETGTIDPISLVGLAFPAIGLVVGAASAGALRQGSPVRTA